MQRTTNYNLYRNGKKITLRVLYTFLEASSNRDNNESIRILHISPYQEISTDEKEELILHCLTDWDLHQGKVLLEEIDNENW